MTVSAPANVCWKKNKHIYWSPGGREYGRHCRRHPAHRVKAEETLIKEVQPLLSHETAGNDEATKSAAIFHDACLLGDMSLNMPAELPAACMSATGTQEVEKIKKQLKI